MARPDFTTHRLFVEHGLNPDGVAPLGREQAHYLLHVLRLMVGAEFLAFNGRDGEWRVRIVEATKRSCLVAVVSQTRPQPAPGDLWYCFAPLKAARLDYMVQKAVEMGASRIVPTLTRHTQPTRLNLARLQANAVEAAEQCGVLAVPDCAEEIRLDRLLAQWPAERRLIFCDEDAETADPLDALRSVAASPLGLLVGPEGGFAAEERTALLARSNVTRLSLGPRILRADTAAVAALALVQAMVGDWRG